MNQVEQLLQLLGSTGSNSQTALQPTLNPRHIVGSEAQLNAIMAKALGIPVKEFTDIIRNLGPQRP